MNVGLDGFSCMNAVQCALDDVSCMKLFNMLGGEINCTAAQIDAEERHARVQSP